jgi:hypothetical protein
MKNTNDLQDLKISGGFSGSRAISINRLENPFRTGKGKAEGCNQNHVLGIRAGGRVVG